MYDQAGNVVARYGYDAWGKLLSVKDGSGNVLTPTTNSTHIGILNPFRYRGYFYDDESGLYYLNSRYYDPETGRFVNSDIVLAGGNCVLGTNLYAYCVNNPVNLSDPSGYFALSFSVALFLGVIGTGGLLVFGVPASMELGRQLEDVVCGINATTYVDPGLTITVPIAPEAEQEKTVAIPQDIAQADTKTRNRPQDGIFYPAILSSPGIIVDLSQPMYYWTAMAYLESGKNVWISDSDFAYNIAFFAAGGTASMRSKGWGACEPVYGSLERMVCLGLNAKHYHVNAYAYGGVHIFYGYQAVNFTM